MKTMLLLCLMTLVSKPGFTQQAKWEIFLDTVKLLQGQESVPPDTIRILQLSKHNQTRFTVYFHPRVSNIEWNYQLIIASSKEIDLIKGIMGKDSVLTISLTDIPGAGNKRFPMQLILEQQPSNTEISIGGRRILLAILDEKR